MSRVVTKFECVNKSKPKFRLSLAVSLALAVNIFATSFSQAETIQSAMAFAYQANPQLNAQRAATRAFDEGVPQARAGLLPRITGDADYGRTKSKTTFGGQVISRTSLEPYGFGITISQTLFDGFKTYNNISSAESAINASRQTLRNTEQNVLFDAASAYMNVIRDVAITGFRKQNLAFLREEVRAAQERFNVGESTRTDVAQARARRAAAQAQLAAARAQLKGSIGVYRQVIGREPKNQKPARAIDQLLPRNLNAAIAIAEREHPAVLTTRYLVDQASFDVKSAEGDLLPTLSLEGNARRRFNSGATGITVDSQSLIARLSVPIYRGGGVSATVRRNKETLGQRRIEVDQTVDQIRASVISAFSQLESARATLTAGVAQLRASRLALSGVIEERNVGQRTTLEVLNTQQDVLNAQITLASARRDSVVAGYALLSSIGRLSAKRMKLKTTLYKPREHYRAVRDKWYGLRTPDQR